jgi:ethanolamine phosphate transferase 2 subunit G
MLHRTRNVLSLAANILLVGAVLIFAVGFFPHKAFLPGLATWREKIPSRTAAPFNKVIFMVVDALRNDFVYSESSNFSFTQGLIRSGAALPFTGHASAPTITMPRVKAITTGSVPSFLDVVLNFAESDTTSTLATQDTWLAQMKAKDQGKLIMFGDDTWLKLFPGFFARSDGTSSFFVSDFTEVDNNVTRHISHEMENDDWSVMVMHFLGLDHIGHKTGPRGPNMPGKQREMDGIVKQIYGSMEASSHHQSSLLVVLGDHGMNDGGNHGGSSAGEVSTALMFISPLFKSAFEGVHCPLAVVDNFKYYDEVEQSDIAPTLASLLGIPIPRNNLGMVIPRLLELWTKDSDRFDILYENALQMHDIAIATFPDAFIHGERGLPCNARGSSDEERLACAWLRLENAAKRTQAGQNDYGEATNTARDFLKLGQEILSGTASNYDLTKMNSGIALAGLASILSLVGGWSHLLDSTLDGISFVVLTGTYAATMFASSYVEEEQQFWYWIFGAWMVVLHCKQSRIIVNTSPAEPAAMAAVAMLFGIVRRWNQTGQKYAGSPDIVSEIFPVHPWLLWTLVIGTYAAISRSLSSQARSWRLSSPMAALPVGVCIAAFTFKVAFTAADAPELLQWFPLLTPLLDLTTHFGLVALARVAFSGLLLMLGCAMYFTRSWKDSDDRAAFTSTVHDILSLFLITQTRTASIPVFLIFILQLMFLETQTVLDDTSLATTSIICQYSSFFMLGGSNSISSVDLSNAYNGVSGYSVLAVGALTFLGNWAGPIWWASAICRIRSRRPAQPGAGTFMLLTLFTSISALAMMLACTLLREHLFIWTVFSPKYLYTLAWVWQLLVNGGLNMAVLGRL